MPATAKKPSVPKSVRDLARRVYGSSVEFRHDPKALVGADRETVWEQQRQMVAEKKALEDEVKASVGCTRRLLKAARFVVDVDGDATALPTLRAAVEAVERRERLGERIDELREQIKVNSGRLICYRCEVTINKGWCHAAEIMEDSWEAVEAKLRKNLETK